MANDITVPWPERELRWIWRQLAGLEGSKARHVLPNTDCSPENATVMEGPSQALLLNMKTMLCGPR